MNVHIERNWAYDGYDIWFWRTQPHSVMRVDNKGISWEKMEFDTEAKPTLTLPTEAMQGLIAEAEKVIPASHATERHLLDTINVRDRLLKLVEEGWTHD